MRFAPARVRWGTPNCAGPISVYPESAFAFGPVAPVWACCRVLGPLAGAPSWRRNCPIAAAQQALRTQGNGCASQGLDLIPIRYDSACGTGPRWSR
eukprot:7808410-Lingulodinium_polyedra.AAC.1